MASIFTYQEEPPRVHSPWSTPGCSTPQATGSTSLTQQTPDGSSTTSITRLEPERQEGPTEYKLHLLLRVRGASAATGPLTTQSRQSRLQQLTTQLLWRLQQSSPFHSSSNADLVLPVLPEATPLLGVPDRPARLLPGLEESQGALYEIGVADDGTLVGLFEDDLEESLTNLRAMAASLGCVVDILRRVLVGCNEFRDKSGVHDAKLWVAEVLVRPDVKSPKVPPFEDSTSTSALSSSVKASPLVTPVGESHVEQLRVAITGASTAGKSSLVGTLTTSTLDNGRGKSRLSLLKHRHEIASGVTSSVAQELIGYRGGDIGNATVVNYASGDVSSWPDIHGLSSRLIFLSDSPGLPRYSKSTFRTLMSWDPHWTLLCVAADEDKGESRTASPIPVQNGNDPTRFTNDEPECSDISLAHLDMCLKLNLNLMIVITKMDVATKSGLKTTLSKILSVLKKAGKLPILLGAPSTTFVNQEENADISSQLSDVSDTELAQVRSCLRSIEADASANAVPIVLTSAVTGAGFGKLHALLSRLTTRSLEGISVQAGAKPHDATVFRVDETFAIPPSRVYSENKQDHHADQGIVLCGHLAKGRLGIGDTVRLGPFWVDHDSMHNDSGSASPSTAQTANGNHRRPPPYSMSGQLSKSLQGERIKLSGVSKGSAAAFMDVYVVSLRSLRLPVRTMTAGETGTVGVQPCSQSPILPLSRARKGMILTSLLTTALTAHRSFTASFSASDFSSMSSAPLILGGHAIIYANNIRAAVKVVAVALQDDDTTEPSSPVDVFSFDDDERSSQQLGEQEKEIRITFKFVSSVEWMEVGDKALVVPTVASAGPISGPVSVAVTGLSGFVGRVCSVSA